MPWFLLLFMIVTTPVVAQTKAEKAFILDWVQNFLVDPYDLRSTGISEATHVLNADGNVIPLICVQYNAKNQLGGYTGIRRSAFLVTDTGIDHGDHRNGRVHTGNCWEPQIKMKPFPELGQIR